MTSPSSSSRASAAKKTSRKRSASTCTCPCTCGAKPQSARRGKKRSRSTKSDEDDEVEEEEWVDDTVYFSPSQPPFDGYDIAAFLRQLFRLEVGQLHTVSDKWTQGKVDRVTTLKFCEFCRQRALLNLDGRPQSHATSPMQQARPCSSPPPRSPVFYCALLADHSGHIKAERGDYSVALQMFNCLEERAERTPWMKAALM
jgi:hypothetical protein